eukprot:8081394-Heterocapsa_arctica.AAC.1
MPGLGYIYSKKGWEELQDMPGIVNEIEKGLRNTSPDDIKNAEQEEDSQAKRTQEDMDESHTKNHITHRDLFRLFEKSRVFMEEEFKKTRGPIR